MLLLRIAVSCLWGYICTGIKDPRYLNTSLSSPLGPSCLSFHMWELGRKTFSHPVKTLRFWKKKKIQSQIGAKRQSQMFSQTKNPNTKMWLSSVETFHVNVNHFSPTFPCLLWIYLKFETKSHFEQRNRNFSSGKSLNRVFRQLQNIFSKVAQNEIHQNWPFPQKAVTKLLCQK